MACTPSLNRCGPAARTACETQQDIADRAHDCNLSSGSCCWRGGETQRGAWLKGKFLPPGSRPGRWTVAGTMPTWWIVLFVCAKGVCSHMHLP